MAHSDRHEAVEPNQGEYRTKLFQIKYLKKFLKTGMIPVLCNRPEAMTEEYHKTFLEHYGFKVKNSKEGFFYTVMPRGWKKFALGGGDNFWCYIIDNKKRRRGAIYFKLMQIYQDGRYDVSTHINYMTRFRARSYADPKDKNRIIGEVIDSETSIIHRDELVIAEGLEDVVYKAESVKALNELFVGCEQWLKKKYPDCMSVSAYWDQKL